MIAKQIPVGTGGSMKRLAHYIADTNGNGNKATDLRITNDATPDNIDDFVSNVERVQSQNTRSNSAKYMHLMLSFNHGDKVDAQQIQEMEDEACKCLGLEGHQRMSAIHRDTDNVHAHIMINTINPETKNNINPSHSHRKLQAMCREMEKRFGLEVDLGKSGPDVSGKASDMESHSGVESFQGWVKREKRNEFIDALNNAKDWGSFHGELAKSGVEVAQRGAGFVLRDIGDKRKSMKASDISRSFSKAEIEKKLGEYQANPYANNKSKKAGYTPKPNSNNHESNKLFSEYKQEMDGNKARKQAMLKDIKQEKETRELNIKRDSGRRRGAIKEDKILGRRSKRRAYQEIAADTADRLNEVRKEAATARSAAIEANPSASWSQWLAQQALSGRQEALDALRNQRQRPARGDRSKGITGLQNGGVSDGASSVNRAGDVIYGSSVRDRGGEINVQGGSEEDVASALKMAGKRYKGGVDVAGDDAFKAATARIAGEYGVDVTFSDKRMESIRVAVTESRQERKPAGQEKGSDGVTKFVEARNAARAKTSDIYYHRRKTQNDQGAAKYGGQRNIEGGGKVALFEKKGEMLVMEVNPTEAARLKKVKVGSDVELTRQGVQQSSGKGKGVER